jgi:hypothetical protein
VEVRQFGLRAENWTAAVLLVIVYAGVCAACALAAPIPGQSTAAATPDLQTILGRMEQAQVAAHAQNLPYTVTRSYQFFGADRSKLSSQVVAQVEYQPPATKSFTIKQTSGSGQGPKIVKQVLQHESDAAKNSGGMITRANYDFEFVRAESLNGAPCYVLQLKPKRESKDAVRGQAWVDANSYLIRHVEGDLTESPSWWVKDVHVVMDFGRIAGIWLQTATLAVANVRFLGKHSMLAQNLALTVATPAMLATSGRVAPRAVAVTRRTRVPVSYAAWGQPAIR